MARFYGQIGYGESVESVPGVHKDVIVEKDAYGDILRNSLKTDKGDKVNADLSINNSISIVANAYAYEHYSLIRYVKLMGAFWMVDSVTIESPRLILRLGGVYNGKKA